MAIPITLRVHRAGAVVETREFHRDLIKIGRLATAHLPIDDPRVSRIHAVIEVGAEGLAVIDMGSVEGTWVGGRRISKSALSSGDSVVMGDTRVEVLVGTAADHPMPAGMPDAAAVPAAPTPTAAEVASRAAGTAVPANVVAGPSAANLAAAAGANVAAPHTGAKSEAAGVAPAPVATTGPVAAPHAAIAGSGQGAINAAPPAEAAPSGTAQAAPAAAVATAAIPAAAPAAQAAMPATTTGARPTGPVPWPSSRSQRSMALEVRFFWGDQQLAAGSFDEVEGPVTVGDGKGATFHLEAGNLPEGLFPLAEKVDGTWNVRFGAGMDGELIHEGRTERLADLARARRARTVGDAIAEVELPPDAAAWVDLGNIRAEFCHRPKARRVFVPIAQRIDYTFVNLLLIVCAFFAASIISFGNRGREADIVADDLFMNQARLTRLLLTPPEQRRNPFLEKLDLKAPGEKVQAPGQEGKAGKQDAPVRNTRSAPKAIKPDDKEIVKNQGILAMLGSGSNQGLSTIFGKGGLGGDLKGAIGGITGASVGDAHGFGGLGLKGTGLGGGAEGETVGVGAIGTKGRGGGIGDYGKGAGGLGKKASAEVTIDTSSVTVVGYDRELVRRVVQQHHSQLRYCFENELIRNPKLGGRIQVKWIITGNGSVTGAALASSTMNNSKVESCIVSRVRGWQFPPPKGGGIATISYPFVFRPAGD